MDWKHTAATLLTGAAAGGLAVHLARTLRSTIGRTPPETVFGPASEAVLAKVKPGAFTFLHADFCPFANRAWIALLEKESDPTQPVLYDEVLCCYFMAEKDPGTDLLFKMGFSTVPAAVHHGQTFTESAELADYVDNLFPQAPLKPADAVMRYNMISFIKSHNTLCGFFYTFIKNQDQDKHAELAEKYTALIQGINADLDKFPSGPYLCGEQFTLADLHIFGFIERSVHVLPYYKNWSIPIEFSNVWNWYHTMLTRPSIKAVTADRSKLSREVMVYEAVSRKDYLIEMYECYARDEVQLAKKLHQEHSKPGQNGYHAIVSAK